ncbi:MAG: DUF4199 domain-containing protein [Bacteroidota bacterium]|jgi:predicted PurR-regulated permease PerM
MSEVFETESMEPVSKYAIAIRYGLMVGFISMFLTTVSFLYMLKLHFLAFTASGAMMFIIPVIFYWIAASRQRKALGGFITMKDAFQVVFIVILISLAISTVYGLIYTKYIDPDCMVRMKEAMLEFFENMGSMPQESIDEQMKRVDETIESSAKASKLLYSFAQSIIIHSIFGFIVALIVKKERQAIPQ